jgi:sugar phosphate isomerase/epimerase
VKPNRYPLPLAVQTVLPPDYLENEVFHRDLRLLQELGFMGVELNIAFPQKENIAQIQRFLDRFDLQLTMLASGLTAKTQGLSLSSADTAVWQKSVAGCLDLIDFVAGSQAGLIVGFLKGGPDTDVQGSRKRFSEALQQIAPFAKDKEVKVLIEATNRYEAAVANDLAAAADLIRPYDRDYMQILPDTFHMNIEEAQGPVAALKQWAGYYSSIHISDNNRLFPGLGAMDFATILTALKEIGFKGSMAIEGNLKHSFAEDISSSAQFLTQLPMD